MKENVQNITSASLIIGGAVLLSGNLGLVVRSAHIHPAPPMHILGTVGVLCSTVPIVAGIAMICLDTEPDEPDLEWEEFCKTWQKSGRTANDRKADQEELVRLKQIPRVQGSMKKLRRKYSIPQLIAYGYCLEKLEAGKETHFLFTHGQHLNWMAVNILAKELLRARGESVKKTHVLRHPVFLAEKDKTVDYYRKKCATSGTTDHDFRSELICVDCYLENESSGESALSFFRGKNVTNPSRWIVDKILKHHLTDPTKIEQITRKILRLSRYLERSASGGGNLFAIQLSKEKFKGTGWISHPYGEPCKCSPKGSDETLRAELLQTGYLDRCRKRSALPGARLLTSRLTKAYGVQVFRFSTLTKSRKAALKTYVRALFT